MRVLVFHGYLLGGTGSNVYNANLAQALVRLGHEVHLLCQEREPEAYPWVDAWGDWDGGRLAVHARRAPAAATVYRPDISGLLPLYVADAYPGVEARPFPELDDAELERYIEANVAAVAEVAGRVEPDVALANHLVMGPLVLARALGASAVPYAVKVHGSALEYTVKPHPRFLPHAREGLAPARCVLVGSRHTAESLWATMDDPALAGRTRLGPPGVDVVRFAPREPEPARAALAQLATRLEREAQEPAGAQASAFSPDLASAAQALATIQPGDRVVVFVGKLIVSKGIDLLLAAWPLVVGALADARLLVVGFGAYRDACERIVAALAAGDLAAVRALADEGRAAEGGPRSRLEYVHALLDELEADDAARDAYLAAASTLPSRVAFSGRLDHDQLVDVLPACEALVFPSTFPEAFGMVAAEAAAAGVLPLSANHSGLAEVTRVLAGSVPAQAAPWLSFDVGPRAVRDIAERLVAWLGAPDALRAQTRAALVGSARERYSWEGVARGVIAAAQGELGDLSSP